MNKFLMFVVAGLIYSVVLSIFMPVGFAFGGGFFLSGLFLVVTS